MKWRLSVGVFSLSFSMVCLSAQGRETRTTIIYDDRPTEIGGANEVGGQLWITTLDLTRATRFELKPQGVCRNELCFPLPKTRQQEFLRKNAGKTWFNLVAFAQLVHQPVVHDQALFTWYFGLRSDQRQALSPLAAPDFTLPDMAGNSHSLSDFRGEKILLLTWASW